MDAGDDPDRERRIAHEERASPLPGQGPHGAGDGRRQERRIAVVVEVVDAREPAQRAEVEAERVAPAHVAERRDVEHLAGEEGVAVGDRSSIRVRDDVEVAFAERVVHFGEHGRDPSRRVVADPEAHRVEHVAQHARERVEHDLARGVDALAVEERADPRQQRRAVARTVVAVVERQHAPTIAGNAERGKLLEAGQGQAQAERRVGERVRRRPRAPMHHLPLDQRGRESGGDGGGQPGGHDAGGAQAATATDSPRRATYAAMLAAAACADLRPSSWKP